MYCEAKARWAIYYDSTNDRMALFSSSNVSGYGLTINTNTYATNMIQIQANTAPLLRCQRTDAGEVSIYLINNTAGWAIGINPWSVGAGVFAIGQYSGTGSSAWRFKIDNNGYCFCASYLNIGGHEKNASSPTYVWGSNSTDNYLRSYQTSKLSVSYAATAGSAGYLSPITSKSIASNGTWAYTLTANTITMFCVTGNAAQATFIVYAKASALTYTEVTHHAGVGISTSGLTATFTNYSGYSFTMYAFKIL